MCVSGRCGVLKRASDSLEQEIGDPELPESSTKATVRLTTEPALHLQQTAVLSIVMA